MDKNIDYSKVKEFVHDANKLISINSSEDVIRHNLSSWMRQMFKDNPWWISVHISGSETKMTYETLSGSNRGFVDSLVGKTVIEYEKNLAIPSIFNTGYLQVKDYCAGLLNDGIDKDDIIGILSDTIEWYAYKISDIGEKEPDQLYAQDMIELEEIEYIQLGTGDGPEAEQFVGFIMKYVAREGSRKLDAINLAKDMGVGSVFWRNYIDQISSIIKTAFESQKSYSDMIENLWSNFISYIGGNSDNRYFSLTSYINEFYIITLAKYLCVNILEGKNIVSSPKESLQILNGNYFRKKGLLNKESYTASVIPGKIVYCERDIDSEYKLLHQGRRSAWSNKPGASEVTEVLEQIPFLQGADIMPRTLIFHRSNKQHNGKWELSKIDRVNDDLSYLVKGAKKHKNFSLEAVNIDDDLMYKCYLSHHVMPFNVSEPADAFLPITRDLEGDFHAISEASLAIRGGSVREAIRSLTAELDITVADYYEKLNYRNKLNPQKFDEGTFLILAGAGGSYVCSGYVDLSKFDLRKVIVDQTLYWYQTSNEDEAIYIVGLLNSEALNSSIAEFQPEGIQGRRHIHKLPYAITPKYDEENDLHIKLVSITRKLMEEFVENIDEGVSELILEPSKSTLQIRRRKVRDCFKQLPSYFAYEAFCRQIYGVDGENERQIIAIL